MNPRSGDDWITRCALRILQVNPTMTGDEALGLAHELRGFERTGAMAPEAAVDFATSAQARPGHRFERRAGPRT